MNNYNDAISLISLIKTFLNYKYIILFSLVVGVFLSTFYYLKSENIYKSTVVTLAQSSSDDSDQYSDLAAVAGIELNTKKNNSNETLALAIANSRDFIDLFIDDNDLLPIIYLDEWDINNSTWKKKEAKTDTQVYEDFKNNIIDISRDNLSGTIVFSFYWKDKNNSHIISNKFIETLNSTVREIKKVEAENNLEYLYELLKNNNVSNLDIYISRLIEKEYRNLVDVSTKKEFVFKVIDPAYPPDDKHSPRLIYTTLLGLIFGLLFSIFISLILIIRKEL